MFTTILQAIAVAALALGICVLLFFLTAAFIYGPKMSVRAIIFYLLTSMAVVNVPLILARWLLHGGPIIPDATSGPGRPLADMWAITALVGVAVTAIFVNHYEGPYQRDSYTMIKLFMMALPLPFVFSGAIWGFLIWLH